MKKILILNGPNLNLLGVRQTDVYGEKTLDELISEIKVAFPNENIIHIQSNHEGVLIDKLHEYGFDFDGIVFNAGAYTHTSIALADAVRSIKTPVIELHISDINKREAYRQKSFLTEVCQHHIIGEGVEGYFKAVEYFIHQDD